MEENRLNFENEDEGLGYQVEENEEDFDEDDGEDEEKALPESSGLQWIARLQTGYEGNLTAQQEEALEELREIMLGSEYKEDCLQWRDGVDRLLLRFLRAECSKKRVFNVKKSEKRLKATLQWRRDNNIDDLLDNPPPTYEKFLQINGETEVIDKEGRVVAYTRAAVLASNMDTTVFTKEEWIQNMACLVENRMAKIREQSKILGHEVSTVCTVYDLHGHITLGVRHIFPFLRLINEVSAAHYPELVDIIYVPYAPRVFSILFNMFKPFLDPVTKEKIKVYSASSADIARFRQDLRSHIPPDRIPKCYGGDWDYELPMPLQALEKGVKTPTY